MPFRAAIVKLFGASSKQSSSSTSGGSTTSDSIAMTVEVVSPLRDAHCSSCSLPLSRNAWQTGLTSRADAKSVDSMPAADDAALPQARLPSHTSPHRPPTALGRNTTRSASLSFGEPSPLVRGGRAMSVLSLSTPPDCAFPEAPADSPPAAARERFIHDRHDRHDQRQPQPGLEPGPGPEPGPVQQQEKQPEQWNHWNGTAARAASVASLLNSGAAATGTFGSGNDGDDDGDDCTIDDDLNAPAGDGGSSSLTFLSSYGGGGYCCCRNSPTVAASSATTSTALRSGGLGGGSGDLQSVAPQEQETPGDFMWLDLNDSPPPPDFEHVLGLITSSTPPSPHQQQQASSSSSRRRLGPPPPVWEMAERSLALMLLASNSNAPLTAVADDTTTADASAFPSTTTATVSDTASSDGTSYSSVSSTAEDREQRPQVARAAFAAKRQPLPPLLIPYGSSHNTSS